MIKEKIHDLVDLNEIFKRNMNPFDLHDMKRKAKLEKQIAELQNMFNASKTVSDFPNLILFT